MEEERQIRHSADSYNVNGYKIQCGYKYKVYVNQYAGNTFYKIQVTKTYTKDGANNKLIAYKNVTFKNKLLDTSEIVDGCYVIPKRLFEDFYFRNNDKYNAVWSVVISDWEVVKSEEQVRNEALSDFNDTLNGIQINEEDLPF